MPALELHVQDVRITALMPGEFWLHVVHALETAGDCAHAAEVAGEGHGWRVEAAATMPEPYRDAFLHCQPVNRRLLALASRLGARE